MKRNLKTRGSALIFILIAIALLGGLTVVLSRTSSNTEETGASERDMITAAELLRDGAYFKSVIDRLILSGCSINEISVRSSEIIPSTGAANLNNVAYNNSSSPSDNRCHVFHENGGGVSIAAAGPPNTGANPFYPFYTFGDEIRTNYNGTVARFEMVLATSVMTKSLCLAVNKIAGVVDPAETPWAWAGSATIRFDGTFPDQSGGFQPLPIGDIRIKGKQGFCISQHARQPPEHYLFIYILNSR